tara:strand:- start:577 stop:1041 length:465 start_codon:yes stop_codon:yes gene_type:complete
MIKKSKNILIFFILISIIGCGYTPLLEVNNKNFSLNKLLFEGDRQVSNYISINLKKYKNLKQDVRVFDLKIFSTYQKSIANKDRSGNPKNYNIKLEVEVNIVKGDEIILSKIFEENTSLAVQNRKIKEKEMETKYKKDLSRLISNNIIFFLSNQ